MDFLLYLSSLLPCHIPAARPAKQRIYRTCPCVYLPRLPSLQPLKKNQRIAKGSAEGGHFLTGSTTCQFAGSSRFDFRNMVEGQKHGLCAGRTEPETGTETENGIGTGKGTGEVRGEKKWRQCPYLPARHPRFTGLPPSRCLRP